MKTIIVGVDGSTHADAALAFAAEEASLRGAALRVVCAWELPGWPESPVSAWADKSAGHFGDAANAIVEKAIARARELYPGIDVQGEALEGHPAEVLLKEAERADIMVLGNRGHGGFANLLLGSVTQHVVHHASCAVVVVR